MTTQSARIPAVFGAYDAGIATLPPELVDAREAVTRLGAALAALGPAPQMPDVRARELAQDLADSARAGDVSITVDELERLEVAGRDHSRRATVVRQAKEFAAQHLSVLVEDMSDEIITDHLAPAMDAVVADMKAAVSKCGDHELSDRAMLSAPKPVQNAWLALDTTAIRYGVFRSVRAALVRTSDVVSNDLANVFGEVRNPEELWDDVGGAGSHLSLTPDKAPWYSEDRKLRLVRMLQMGCVLWIPTPEQQEQRWRDVYGARLEEAKVNRQKLTGSRHAFG